MESWIQDIRYGLRGLCKNPRFALIAVLTLAVGIAASVAVFAIVYGILLAPFPYRDFARVVTLSKHDLAHPEKVSGYFPIPRFEEIRQQNRVFEQVIGYYPCDVRNNDYERTDRWTGACGTADSLQFFGIQPILGRVFTPSDVEPDAALVFVMSNRLWRSEFNADPSIVGKTLTLNDRPRTLIGIMPPHFAALSDPLVYLPLKMTTGAEGTSFFGSPASFHILARLKPGVTSEAAAADITLIARRAEQRHQVSGSNISVTVDRAADQIRGPYRRILFALCLGVLLLLLIACSNVANLLLTRSTARQQEIAVRAALGASPLRLVRQLLAESSALAVAAAISGSAFAYVGLRVVRTMLLGQSLPGEARIELQPAVLGFAVALSAITTLLCGLAPAFQVRRPDILHGIISGGKSVGSSHRASRMRSALLIAEVAFCIVLLVSSGLMLRTVLALSHVDLGFNPAKILYAQLAIPVGRYDRGDQKQLLIRPILDRVGHLPGVIAATESVSRPPSGWGDGTGVTAGGVTGNTLVELISEGYFDTVGVHLLRGRLLTATETDTARHLAVVNESFVRSFSRERNLVGQTIHLGGFDRIPSQPPDAPHSAEFEVVGVVSDYRNDGLREPPQPQVFIPYTVTGVALDRTIMLRTATDSDLLLNDVAKAVWMVDPDIAVGESGTIESYLTDLYYEQPRFEMRILTIFAALGLLLVSVAIFSAVAYSVSLQTREIGIRVALGASPSAIVFSFVRAGLALILIGSALGIVASAALTRLLASEIWGVTPNDPGTFFVVVALVLAVGLAASFVPARRAAAVDPMIALRYE